VQPSGGQGQQQQQLLVPSGLGSQFTLVPANQANPSQLNTKPVHFAVSSLFHLAMIGDVSEFESEFECSWNPTILQTCLRQIRTYCSLHKALIHNSLPFVIAAQK